MLDFGSPSEQYAGDRGSHHGDQGAAEHGAQTDAGEVVAAVGYQGADAADLEAHGHEVAETAEGKGRQGEGLVRQRAGHVPKLDKGQELPEEQLHAQELTQGQRLLARR